MLADLEQKWAYTPEPDYSNTAPEMRYGGRIARLMNDAAEWIGHGTNDRPRVAFPAIEECFIPSGRGNRPGLALDYRWVTVHDTDNRSARRRGRCAHVTT